LKHPLQDEKTRRKYHKKYIKTADAEEKLFKKVLKKYWKGQEERVIETFTGGKGMRNKGVNDFFNIELEIAVCKETFIPLLTEMLERAGIDTIFGAGENFLMDTNIMAWLDEKASIFSTQINETTFETLKEVISEAVTEGQTYSELAGTVKETYGDISKARAVTIARTETGFVMSKGRFESYKQAGTNIKIWVAVIDSRTRDSHAMLDGEERPLDMPFSNGLMYPREFGASAEEVINCRCDF